MGRVNDKIAFFKTDILCCRNALLCLINHDHYLQIVSVTSLHRSDRPANPGESHLAHLDGVQAFIKPDISMTPEPRWLSILVSRICRFFLTRGHENPAGRTTSLVDLEAYHRQAEPA